MIVISWLPLAVPSPPPPGTKTKLTPTPLPCVVVPVPPPTSLPDGAPPEPGEAGAVQGISALQAGPSACSRCAGLRAAPVRPPAAAGPRESAAAPGAPAEPARKQPPSGCRCRPLRRHRALSSRHRSASGRAGSPRSTAGPAAGHRRFPEASPELSPAGPGRPRPPRGANGEVLTYLSLLSTPSWIHLSTSPQSIVGKPSPALLPARRPAGEGGGRRAARDGTGDRERDPRPRPRHGGIRRRLTEGSPTLRPAALPSRSGAKRHRRAAWAGNRQPRVIF